MRNEPFVVSLWMTTSVPVCGFHRRRQVVRGICIEESVWLQKESDVCRRHDRIVLRPWNVRVPEGIPEDDIFVLDVPISFRPACQSVTSRTLVGIVAAGIDFRRPVGGDPDVRVEESGALADPDRQPVAGTRQRRITGWCVGGDIGVYTARPCTK